MYIPNNCINICQKYDIGIKSETGILHFSIVKCTHIYRVIHEEYHSFRELICHVMLMKKVHMNMGPIFHITGNISTIFEIELR